MVDPLSYQLNYDFTSNIQEVVKLYELGDKVLKWALVSPINAFGWNKLSWA